MRIHHLDCGSLRPLCARLSNGTGPWLRRGRLVCHCLLLETHGGLVLVDAGIGTADLGNLGMAFRLFAGPVYDPADTAVARVAALGFRPEDVTDIVVTHLDLDHAGGIADFPRARVHVDAGEHAAAVVAPSWRARLRYVRRQWGHGPRWETYGGAGEEWFGMAGTHRIRALADEVRLVPLSGHSPGHCGVAVRGDDGWILHCGDAYFHHGQFAPEPRCPPGLAVFQWAIQWDARERRRSFDRLRAVPPEVRRFCAHDPAEFDVRAGPP
ncbi:MAG: MBL fold metallo-hydrolase [Planctomycetes bacterium]|nr:MBL fold metallo-hydrolase [Planctomycetota bacterium]